MHVEVPSAASTATARLLDRTGKPLTVPVASATRDDTDGSRWASADRNSRRSRRETIWSRCPPIPRERWCRFEW